MQNFVAIGGASRAAMRLLAAAEQLFGELALPPADFYQDSSIDGIASTILRRTRAASGTTA